MNQVGRGTIQDNNIDRSLQPCCQGVGEIKSQALKRGRWRLVVENGQVDVAVHLLFTTSDAAKQIRTDQPLCISLQYLSKCEPDGIVFHAEESISSNGL